MKNNSVNELSEILATALASRPDLNKRLSTLMAGSRGDTPAPKKRAVLSKNERRARARRMFYDLNRKHQEK